MCDKKSFKELDAEREQRIIDAEREQEIIRLVNHSLAAHEESLRQEGIARELMDKAIALTLGE